MDVVEGNEQIEMWLGKLDRFEYQGRLIPTYMHGGIIKYLVHHIRPGDFLLSLLACELRETLAHADDKNLWLIPVYYAFFYNNLPSEAWGSREKVTAWLRGEAES
jgi:hypothetical protein